MSSAAKAPAISPTGEINWTAAMKEAAFATLVTFGLCFPIVALKTVQNMANELVLESRWDLVLTLCATVFIGRLAITALEVDPDAEAR